MSTQVQLVPHEFYPDTHRTVVNGESVLSVTQIIEAAGLTDFSMVAPEVLKRKQQLGSLVHQACHYSDVDDLDAESLPEEVRERLESYQALREGTQYTPRCHETRYVVIVDRMRYSMQFDSYGLSRGIPWLVDIKNTAQKSPTWGIQLAAYEMAIPRPVPYSRYTRVAAWLLPKRKWRAVTFSDPGDYDAWRACYLFVVRPEWATPGMIQGAGELLERWKSNKGIGGAV